MLTSEELSPRQRQVLERIVAGKSNSVIAGELGISTDGVKWHVSELLGKTGLASRRELAAWWQRETAAAQEPRRRVFLPARVLSHPAAGAAARLAAVAAITAAIAAGIVIAASHRGPSVGLIVPSAGAGLLAYVRDGDVWVQPLPDGEPRRITNTGGAQMPRWSASGAWRSFEQGARWHIVRADGSDGRTVDAMPAWAPSGDRFAIVDPTGAISVENADGSGHQLVVPPPFLPAGVTDVLGGPQWSPDGQWLAYTEHRQQPGRTPPYTYAGIWLVSAGGGAPAEVYSSGDPPRDDVGLYGWTPDSHALLFALDPSFSASAPNDGLPLQAIEARIPPVPAPRAIAPAPPPLIPREELWQAAPGGNTVAITDGAGRETWHAKRIALFSWAAGTVTDLTDATTAAIQPAWSPDAARIAYSAAPDAADVAGGDPAKAAMAQRKIWTMNADGTGQRELTSDPAYRDERPLWSRDGKQIVFVRLDAQDRASLWIVDAGGGEPRRLADGITVPGEADAPVWFGYYGYIAWDAVFALWPGP